MARHQRKASPTSGAWSQYAPVGTRGIRASSTGVFVSTPANPDNRRQECIDSARSGSVHSVIGRCFHPDPRVRETVGSRPYRAATLRRMLPIIGGHDRRSAVSAVAYLTGRPLRQIDQEMRSLGVY